MDRGAWWAAVHGVAKSQTRLSNLTFTFHFHALEKEMATHSIVLAWRIPWMGEPGGLPSMGSHRVGHDWSDLAAAVAAVLKETCHQTVGRRYPGPHSGSQKTRICIKALLCPRHHAWVSSLPQWFCLNYQPSHKHVIKPLINAPPLFLVMHDFYLPTD